MIRRGPLARVFLLAGSGSPLPPGTACDLQATSNMAKYTGRGNGEACGSCGAA
jgi:hypothetical protein